MNLTASQNVTRTYVELCEGLGPPTFQQSFSTLLLALDLNGQTQFATRVWNRVTAAFNGRGESYAQQTLDDYWTQILRFGSDGN